jgi:predicted GIY-YIG superfamily endonuclease
MRPKKCGIYFLMSSGQIVYIGKTTNLEHRIQHHDQLTVLKCFFRRPKLKISIEWKYDEEKKNLLIDSPRITIESIAIKDQLEKMPHMKRAI